MAWPGKFNLRPWRRARDAAGFALTAAGGSGERWRSRFGGFRANLSDAVADSMNARPRKTLDFATLAEHFSTLLAGVAG
jgi:hypothetical protein